MENYELLLLHLLSRPTSLATVHMNGLADEFCSFSRTKRGTFSFVLDFWRRQKGGFLSVETIYSIILPQLRIMRSRGFSYIATRLAKSVGVVYYEGLSQIT